MMTIYVVAFCYATLHVCTPMHLTPAYTTSPAACEQQRAYIARGGYSNLQCMETQIPAWQPVGQ